MAFLTFRNATKHVVLILGVDRTSSNAEKAKYLPGFRPEVSQATPSREKAGHAATGEMSPRNAIIKLSGYIIRC